VRIMYENPQGDSDDCAGWVHVDGRQRKKVIVL
jgi:hypothetical protein